MVRSLLWAAVFGFWAPGVMAGPGDHPFLGVCPDGSWSPFCAQVAQLVYKDNTAVERPVSHILVSGIAGDRPRLMRSLAARADVQRVTQMPDGAVRAEIISDTRARSMARFMAELRGIARAHGYTYWRWEAELMP